jgi:hypothetical protein
VTITSSNGDYILTLLPPGTYKATFQLSGFQRVEREAALAPTQVLPLDITFSPEQVKKPSTSSARRQHAVAHCASRHQFPQTLIARCRPIAI